MQFGPPIDRRNYCLWLMLLSLMAFLGLIGWRLVKPCQEIAKVERYLLPLN